MFAPAQWQQQQGITPPKESPVLQARPHITLTIMLTFVLRKVPITRPHLVTSILLPQGLAEQSFLGIPQPVGLQF